MTKYRIAVLGSGIAGLTVALKLQLELDVDIDLIERGTATGGRLRTLEIEGNKYDIGATIITPHLLHIIEDILGVKDINTVPVDLDIIATEDREPMRLDFGKTSIDDIEKILDKGQLSTEWILANIGIEGLEHIEGMTSKSMLQYFNELQDLPAKLKTYLTAGFIAANISIGRMEATGLDLLAFSHSFQYPTGGVGQIANKLTEAFTERGGTVLLNTEVTSLTATDEQVTVKLTNMDSDTASEQTYDYVVSTIGVGHTLDALTNQSTKLAKMRKEFATTTSTIQPTLLMFKMKEKPEFKGRTGLTLYYPLDTMEELNQYIEDFEHNINVIHGFYIHYPAYYDPDASNVGEYPIQLWFPSIPEPTEQMIEKYLAYGKEQMDKYFIDDFSTKAELVRVFRPHNAIPIYNHPGTVSRIGPYVGYPVFDSVLTPRVRMAGSGASVKFSPSTIQAQMSGLKVAIELVDELRIKSWSRRFFDWLESLFH